MTIPYVPAQTRPSRRRPMKGRVYIYVNCPTCGYRPIGYRLKCPACYCPRVEP